jgi:hypothetical protein
MSKKKGGVMEAKKNGEGEIVNSESGGTPKRSQPFLGLLLVVSAALLSIVFLGAESIQYGAGYTAGKLFLSLAFALPVFIAFKYGTKRGKQLNMASGVNLLCYIVLICWGIQIAFSGILPHVVASLATNTTNPTSSINNAPPKGNVFDQFDEPKGKQHKEEK